VRPAPGHGRVPDAAPVAGGRAVHRHVLVAVDAIVVPDRALVRRRGRAPRGRLPLRRRGAAARRGPEPGPWSAAGAPRPPGRAGAARGGQEAPGPWRPRRGSGRRRGRRQRGDAAPAQGDHRGGRRIRLGLGGVGERGRAVAHPVPVPDLLRVGHPGDREAQERRARPGVPPVGAREGARASAPEARYGPVGRIR